MTKADHFTALSDFLSENPDTVFPTDKGNISAEQMGVFLAHELELLAKKNSADKHPTAQQTANEGIKTAILEGMEADKPYTITDLLKTIPACADLTNQRVSALVRQLVDAGLVIRTEDKRKAFFTKA
jgi:hypothetical protein